MPVNFKAVAAGSFHSLLLDVQGQVWGIKQGTVRFQAWDSNTRIQFITAGGERSYLIDEEGGFWIAESDVSRHLQFAQRVAEITDALTAACKNHFIVVDWNGAVWVWGSNNYGELGLGKPALPSEILQCKISKNDLINNSDLPNSWGNIFWLMV